MRINRVLSLIFCILLTFNALEAQITNPDQARKELAKKNISEDEIDRRLKERGIDVNNIDPTNPAELAEIEIAIQDVIAEIEAEMAAVAAQKPTGENTAEETVGNLAKAGSEVENAIAEELVKEEAVEAEKIKALQNTLPDVKVYGQELFREYVAPEKSSNKPPSNYIVGSRDEIGIAIFGTSEVSFSYEINEAGYIQPQSLGRIYLKGLTFAQAEELLRKRFARSYSFSPEEFAITINYSRQMTVNVVGSVFKPGSYTISATQSAIDALSRAGGPSDIGSLRKIKVIGDRGTKSLDIYKYLQNPPAENSFFLSSNDYVHVPIFEKQVRIDGAVKRPMIYELIDNEGLSDLINFAGGLTANAYDSNIQITRFVDNKKKVIDVNYQQLLTSNSDFQLLNGDVVIIKRQTGVVENIAKIEGAVAYPGDFELTSGMKITDLLKRGEILDEAYLAIAFLQRRNPDGTISYVRLNLEEIIASTSSDKNLTLLKGDRLKIYFQSERTTEDESNFIVKGAVQNPGTFRFGTGETVRIEDAIQIAGGVKQDAKTEFAYLIRTNPVTSEPEYVRFNLNEVLNNSSSTDNVVIKPSDVIQIFSTSKFQDESFVDIIGAVRTPGEYRWHESLTLKDVLSLSGGVTLSAAKNRVEVFRLVVEDNNKPTETIVATVEVDKDLNILSGNGEFPLAPYDIIAVRYILGFDKQELVSIQGETNYKGSYPIISDNERISDLIGRAGGLTPEAFPAGATLFRTEGDIGYVIIDLEDILENSNSLFNITLKKGDVLFIPKAQELVTIQGATLARELYTDEVVSKGKISVPFLRSKNAREYVNEYAAGFADNARKGKLTVQYPNGQMKRTINLGIAKIYPKIEEGSVINVPYKTADKINRKKEKDESTVDWAKVLGDSITQATAILTLVILLQNLNN